MLLVAWEVVKWLGGDPWRVSDGLGVGVTFEHQPPFHWAFASDLVLPHWFNILAVLGQPVQTGTQTSLAQFLAGAAF